MFNYLVKSNSKCFKAFTLVELLVVISIIALLLSILMPSLQRAREQAKKVICKSNMGNAALACEMYSVDNRGTILPAMALLRNTEIHGWYDLISGYISQKEGNIYYTVAPAKPKNSLLICPSNILLQPTTVIYAVGFAMNARRGMVYENYGTYNFVDKGIKQMDIKNPYKKIVLSDARQQIPGRDGISKTVRNKSIYWWTLGVVAYKPADYYVGRDIHKDDGSNFLWSDGHVSSEKYKDWDADPWRGWWAIKNVN